MNVNTIRRLDFWCGRPLCMLLTAVRRAGGLVRRERVSSGAPEGILFIKLIEQGASVLACDAFRRAAALAGRDRVYIYVFEENRPILDLIDLIPKDNVISIRNSGFVPFALDMLKALWTVRRLRVDAAVDLEFFSRASAILAYLSGARTRVGLHRFTSEGPYRGDLMTHRVQFNPHLHTATLYSLLVEALSLDPGEVPLPKIVPPASTEESVPRFVPGEASVMRVRSVLGHSGGGTSGPIVLLNSNASDLMPLRKWPQERFVELGRRLLASDDRLHLAITGAPSEREAAVALAGAIGSSRAVSVAGRTTLYELMTLYTLADVLVTNDSGPGHFAALTGIDTVVLFGPETAARYGPLGPRCHVMSAGLACSPCVNAFNHRFSPCTINRCMLEITVDQVFEAVGACLAARRRA